MPGDNDLNMEQLVAQIRANNDRLRRAGGPLAGAGRGPDVRRNVRPVPENPQAILGAMEWRDDGAHGNGEWDIMQALTAKSPVPSNAKITMRELFGFPLMHEADKAMKTHGDANLYGVELEIEQWPNHIEDTAHTGFKFVADGSLRGSSVEAVAYPNTMQGIIVICKSLWTKYNVKKDNFSERTSIHVHANVSHFTEDQIKTLMLAYATLEDLLFDFIGSDRYKNIFCVPWSEAGLAVGRFRDFTNTPRFWQKYTALNLCPIRTQGTVEFRHMEGNADPERLTNWLQLIDDLLWYARNTPYDQAFNTISNLNTNSEYFAWASAVLKNSIGLFSYEQVRAKLARGVIEAKLLAI
jgi:hypothetical protein